MVLKVCLAKTHIKWLILRLHKTVKLCSFYSEKDYVTMPSWLCPKMATKTHTHTTSVPDKYTGEKNTHTVWHKFGRA